MAEGFLESIGLAELLPKRYQEGYNAGYSAGLASVTLTNVTPSASNWKRYANTYFHAKISFSRTANGAILGSPISGKYSWSTWYFSGNSWPADWGNYITDVPSSMTQISSCRLNVNQAVGCQFSKIGNESSVSNVHSAAIVYYLRPKSIDIFFNSLNVPASGVSNPGVTGIVIVPVAAVPIYII